MKILAIEREMGAVNWSNCEAVLEQEANHVFNLYVSDIVRETYFTEDKKAVLLLETQDKSTAQQLLETLPLVKSGLIVFDIMELKPYTGYERLIMKE